jgi:hypothetical protein
MSGGQGRLQPSPGNFFVASMPEFAADGDFAGGVVEHVGRYAADVIKMSFRRQ